MKRIVVFPEGNMMGAMIGPDLAVGLGGFGETVKDAPRDLANGFDERGYSLNGNVVTVEVSGKLVSADGLTPSDAIRKLAWIVEERGYTAQDFPDLD